VLDRPNLPEDDHPIPLSAPTDLQLDYVALGHWHNPKTFADAAGQERMAYSGVHEPMRFAGETESAGWLAYAPAGTRDEFIDRGPGTALRVTLTEPKAPPDVQVVQVGHFKWEQQPASVSSADDLARLISDVAQRPDQERTLLKLRLTGTIPLEAVSRIVDLREILDRYVVGEMDEQQLHVAPTDEEIREEIGSGLLKIVYERLLAQRADPDPQRAAVAAESVRLLYELVNSLR
jgi:DNA repair exonuclease SbcCD nuclease subunit